MPAKKAAQAPATRGAKVSRVSEATAKEHDEIHEMMVQAVKDSERAAVLFWRALSAAHRTELAQQRGFKSTSDYLVAEFGWDRRSAQHSVRMVSVWNKLKLETDIVEELGPTRCREIAIFLDRSEANKRTAQAFISKVRREGLTARQIQDLAAHQLEDQDTATSGKGQRRDHEPRKVWTLNATETDKQAILESLPDLEAITGSSDTVENIKLACVELANSRSENPEEALEFATKQVSGIQRGLDQVVNSIVSLQGTQRERDEEMADELMSKAMHVVVRSLAAISGYVSPDTDIDPETVFRVTTGGKKALRKTQQRNFANTCLLLARICGAPDKDIVQLRKSILPDDE